MIHVLGDIRRDTVYNESILTSIKKMLGITEEQTAYDTDIIININGAFAVLNQLGIGPDEGYFITGSDDTWGDFLPDNNDSSVNVSLSLVKVYVYLKTKITFDPPTIGSVMDSTKQAITEYEWRLRTQAELITHLEGGINQNGV